MSSNGESMIICKKCGTENKNGDSFCKGCGSNLLEQKSDEALSLPKDDAVVVCKKCGSKPQRGDLFCRGCGGSLLEIKSIKNPSKVNTNIAVWISVIGLVIGMGIVFISIVPNMSNNNDYTTEAQPAAEEAMTEMAPTYEPAIATSTSEDVFVDTDTNLMWQDDIEAKEVTKDWRGAIDYCEDLSLAGFNDWRLPDQDSLEALYPKQQYLTNVVSAYYWSSSSSVSNSNYAWNVVFYNGGYNYNNKRHYFHVRCVRDSK
jgi:ribosomal protein L40E